MKIGNKSFIVRMVFLGLLNTILISISVSDATPAKAVKLEVIRVGLDRKSFNPSKGQKVSLGFEITKKADTQVSIYDVLGQRVKKFKLSDVKAGRHEITWDGRKSDGKLPAGDLFLYVIEAKTKDGEQDVYNPAAKTGGFEVKSLEYTLDRKTGRIEYVLPKTCMIRIRAGIKDGMFAMSLFGERPWKPSTAGRHFFIWNGKDSSGQMYVLKNPNLDLRLTCYTLPSNTIITTGGKTSFNDEKPSDIALSQRDRLWGTKGKYFHYRHNPRICHQPKFKILFSENDKTNEKGIPLVSGVVPIRIELDPLDETHLINTRFEVMLFVDGVFIYEIEEGSSPFTFNWNTKGFSKGPHLVTINLVGYDDHIGIASHKVIIGE